jgi:hypothetical protein
MKLLRCKKTYAYEEPWGIINSNIFTVGHLYLSFDLTPDNKYCPIGIITNLGVLGMWRRQIFNYFEEIE